MSEPQDHGWVEALLNLIKEEGYRAKLNEEGDIESAASGYSITIIPSPPMDLQFMCGVRVDAPIPLEVVNKYNTDYRFAKVHLDSDGDPVLRFDIILDPTSPEAPRLLHHAMFLFEGSLRLFRDMLDDVHSGEPAKSPSGAIEGD